MKFSVLLALSSLCVCLNGHAQDAQAAEPIPAYIKIPLEMDGFFKTTINMTAELVRPVGPGPFPVVLYSHGRSYTSQERAALREVVPRDYLRFWLAKGFAVVAPMRPGYGLTGGPDREIPGHSWDGNGNCIRTPDYRKVMDIAAPTIFATIAWVKQQAWANPSALVLTGNSVGGLLTVAVGSRNPVGVLGFINFAGGIGGNPSQSPGKSCQPDQLRDMHESYGKAAKIPSLWMYAQNDLFWGAQVPKGWHAAFAQGGSDTRLQTTAALTGKDGHDLVFEGKELWTAPVSEFVQRLGY